MNRVLSHFSNYIVDVVTGPKFGHSSTSVREVTITSILERFAYKNRFFEGGGEGSWFKFSNL